MGEGGGRPQSTSYWSSIALCTRANTHPNYPSTHQCFANPLGLFKKCQWTYLIELRHFNFELSHPLLQLGSFHLGVRRRLDMGTQGKRQVVQLPQLSWLAAASTCHVHRSGVELEYVTHLDLSVAIVASAKYF